MKKTLVALLALGGVALASSSLTETIIVGGTGKENPWGYGTYATHANGAPDKGTANAVIVSGTLNSGVTYEMKHSTGKTWLCNIADDWTNVTALKVYNDVIGQNLTAEQLTSGTLSASAGGTSYETFTLNFSEAEGWYAGRYIDIFAFVATNPSDNANRKLTGFTVTGLEGFTISVASATGNGFDGKYSEQETAGAATLSLVRINGFLDENMVVTLKADGNKSGFAAVSFTVPEPTTATLSLLALAGLAARRRRK